jgi:transposase
MVRLPPSPRDWLPSGHLAWFIHDAVEELEVDDLEIGMLGERPCGKGHLPCPPRVMLSLLIYAYCTGTFSSRRIAANTEISIAFRVLATGYKPDRRTISRFRDENFDQFNRLFLQVAEIAREARLVKMGTIVIDSRKGKAKASERKAMSTDFMLEEERRLRAEIAKLTRAAKKQDELDEESIGPDEMTSCRPRRSAPGSHREDRNSE